MSLVACKIFLSILQLPRFPTHTFPAILLGGCFIEYSLLFLYSNYVYEWSCPLWTSEKAACGYLAAALQRLVHTNDGLFKWCHSGWEAEHSFLTHPSTHMVELEDIQSQQCHSSCLLFMCRKKSVNMCCSCMLIVFKECFAHAVNDLQVWDKYWQYWATWQRVTK